MTPATKPVASAEAIRSTATAQRVTWAFLAAGWLGLVAKHAQLMVPSTEVVHHPVFPTPFLLPEVAGVALATAAGAALVAALSPQQIAGMWMAAVGMASSAVLLLHAATFADASFWATFWVSAWLLWTHLVPVLEVQYAGPRLAQAVIALAFLGGAVGKLTAGYWNGDVLFALVLNSDATLFPALRQALPYSFYRDLSTFVSQMAILTEWLVALSVVLPSRWALRLMLAVAAGMCALISSALAVIMLPLAGLAFAGMLLAETANTAGWSPPPAQVTASGKPSGP